MNERGAQFLKISEERVVFLDGAMGTMIQKHPLTEEDFRGERFKDSQSDLKGNNELLTLTRPDIIGEIHRKFFKAGCDIVETNTFSATTIAQADYHLEALVDELNVESAKLARQVAEECEAELGRPCFVAGAMGPTNKTASMSPDVNRPEYRAATFDDLRKAYKQQAAKLLEGGADVLLPETTFDTLNVKAACFAIEELFEERGERVPVIISFTITDQSGRTLSGQTVEAFWNSVRHFKPNCIGINCALGADAMRPYIEELARIADCYVHVYPNAGLPNPLSETGYDEEPADTAKALRPLFESGRLNMVGGCCGTTPEHIAAVKAMVEQIMVPA